MPNLLVLVTFLIVSSTITIYAQDVFAPPAQKMVIETRQIEQIIEIDGNLDEAAWKNAIPINGFTQRDPFQGDTASYDTEVKILYNEKFLYISAICKDDLYKRSNIRVLNMQRDFIPYENDRFGIAIDGFLDGQNAIGFEVTPYGAQREVQVIDGEEFRANKDWDGLWYVKTKITDTAWVAEMAIPWKTIRYKEGTQELLVSFTRNIRRNNEVTTFPSYPRAFSHFRMAYAARLVGIQPPPPSANLQLNPYILANTTKTNTGNKGTEFSLKTGGEVKWAINSNTILDLTANTDFAQANVDQQVQNLSRFSVLFPERRQFFLENANVFKTSISSWIQPFFSRRIGLNDEGEPIALNGGVRLTSQTKQHTFGLLAMSQREIGDNPLTHFLVGRYVKNFSSQNRAGLMITHREEQPFETNTISLERRGNTTATFNTFIRPSQTISIEGMVSASFDNITDNGIAAHGWIAQEENWGYLGFIGQYVSQNYNPRSGFLAFSDYILASPGFDFDLRPAWLPKYIRSYGPDLGIDIIWKASDYQFQQALIDFALIDLEFDKGGDIEFRFRPEWQQLDEDFTPLGIDINAGYYAFTRYDLGISTNFSKKVAGEFRYETGGYYDGRLNSYYADVRVSPIPHVELTAVYNFNEIKSLGQERTDINAHLFIANVRLALNPRVQMITNYQWNSATKTSIWNARFSWEYTPLSYLFLVFNSSATDDFLLKNRLYQQDFISKFTFLKQF